MKNNRLPTLKFTVQTGDTPHRVTVPASTTKYHLNKRKLLDAVDAYNSILLDKDSQPLTTFITEWGRFMYLRMPQGYLASGDAYTRRYDEVIKDISRKEK